MHVENSLASHSPLIVISGEALMMIGTDYFNPTIINATIPLKSRPLQSAPTYFPAWCCVPLSKYISSAISTQSVEISPMKNEKTIDIYNVFLIQKTFKLQIT